MLKKFVVTFSQFKLIGFLYFLLQRFAEIGIVRIAGSLTYTTLLALVPLLTVMLVVITAFPVFNDITAVFIDFIRSTVVPSGASVIVDYLNEFKTAAGRLTSIGIVMMVVTSLMLVQTIDETFNRIWRVQQQRSLFIRLPIYWMLLTLGPLVLGISISVSTYFMRLDSVSHLPYFAIVLKFFGQLIFDTVFFCILFRVVPNCYVPMKHALVGAVVTSILLETVKWGFSVYINGFSSYHLIYGAFAAIPVFLIWLQMLWMVILFGALFTACLSYWHGCSFRQPNNHAYFDDAIMLLIYLTVAHQHGEVANESKLQQYRPMGYDQLYNVLHQLERFNYIERVKNGWILKTAPEAISLNHLFAQLVYQPSNILPKNFLTQLEQNQLNLTDLPQFTQLSHQHKHND